MHRRDFLHSAVDLGTASLALDATLTTATSETNPQQESPKMNTDLPIVIAADPFAKTLKDAIVTHLNEKGYKVLDLGTPEDLPYYDGAVAACRTIQSGKAERAILLCGTGMGVAVIANRFKGIVASVVESVFAARMCRAINNANVLCLGSMIWGDWMAKEAVDAFLCTQFTEGLEPLADYLRDAEKKVEAIRD
jgi:ribose 5-phosphate isomerase B